MPPKCPAGSQGLSLGDPQVESVLRAPFCLTTEQENELLMGMEAGVPDLDTPARSPRFRQIIRRVDIPELDHEIGDMPRQVGPACLTVTAAESVPPPPNRDAVAQKIISVDEQARTWMSTH